MLLRLRWFIMGAERLTPRNLANSGMRSVAEMLDSAAESVAPADRSSQ